MKIGYIGLGRMGKNMVFHLLEQGVEIVAWNRSPKPVEEVVKAGAVATESIEDLVIKLRKSSSVIPSVSEESQDLKSRDPSALPQDDNIIIWLMLPAGDITDEYIDKLLPLLSKGDLIIDGANSFYKDTLRRNEKISAKEVHFMDIGTSGGPNGARIGACLMIGGTEEDFKKVEELCKAAAAPGAYQHLGPVGSGHFAKMVHNAIEYGMMESIGEGLAILKQGPFKYDFVKLLDLYNHRSVVESRLVGWLLEAFKEDPNLSNISSSIGSGGSGKRIPAEADWTVEMAQKEMGIDVPAMEASIKVRENSSNDLEDSPNGFRNKVISAMRGVFGQHDVKKN